MDKLINLTPVLTNEANEEAEAIYKLMQEAGLAKLKNKQTSIIYITKPNKRIHPLVLHVLTSKGYIIDDVTYKQPNGITSFNYSSCTKYSITIN